MIKLFIFRDVTHEFTFRADDNEHSSDSPIIPYVQEWNRVKHIKEKKQSPR